MYFPRITTVNSVFFQKLFMHLHTYIYIYIHTHIYRNRICRVVCLYVSYCKCYFIVLFKNNVIYLFMWFILGCAGSWLLWEFLSGCSAQASFCGGFIADHRLQSSQTSVVASPRLWSTGSIVVAHKLSFSAACGVFPDHGSNLCLLQWQKDSLPLSTREALSHCSCYMTVHTDLPHSF